MNRALYLARPDPDENDLKFTAVSIYSQICQNHRQHEKLIEDLASSYNDLKKHWKNTMSKYEDFYGLRDFYHMIKHVSREINKGEFLNAEKPE